MRNYTSSEREIFLNHGYLGGEKQLQVEHELYRGRYHMVGIRSYRCKKDGSLAPTRNGISFSVSELQAVIAGLLMLHDYAEAQGWIGPPVPIIPKKPHKSTETLRKDHQNAIDKATPKKSPPAASLRAFDLHRQGMTYEQIAAQLGISRATVARYLKDIKSRATSGETVTISNETRDETSKPDTFPEPLSL